MDDDDAEMFAVADRSERADLALVDNVAFVRAGGMHAGKHFHQRRLASAVLAADRMNLAFLNDEIDVAERLHAWKRLGDVPHFQNCGHKSLNPPEASI